MLQCGLRVNHIVFFPCGQNENDIHSTEPYPTDHKSTLLTLQRVHFPVALAGFKVILTSFRKNSIILLNIVSTKRKGILVAEGIFSIETISQRSKHVRGRKLPSPLLKNSFVYMPIRRTVIRKNRYCAMKILAI